VNLFINPTGERGLKKILFKLSFDLIDIVGCALENRTLLMSCLRKIFSAQHIRKRKDLQEENDLGSPIPPLEI